MSEFRRKLASLLLSAAAAAVGLAAAPVSAAEEKQESGEKIEKPKRDSRDLRTAKQLHVQFTSQMGVHRDLALQDYVTHVGQKLAAVSDRPDLDWTFTIVDQDAVNAFATMEGYVYISRGILPYFQNEAELAAVLGHEIAHITAGHLKSRQRKSTLANIASAATAIFTGQPALADLTSLAGAALISGYGREAELEADRLGAEYLARAGYDPRAMIEVVSTLKDQDTFERERARAEKREPRIYHGVFATHPDNDTRLQEAIATAGKSAGPTGTTTENREAFLRAVDGLPVGSSARQGMVRDNRFYHSDMQFTLAFPRGWQVVNEPQQILAIAPDKDHFLQIRTQAPPADLTDPGDFARRGLANRRVDRSETMQINGLKAWTGVVRGDPSPFGRSSNVRYIVIYYGNLMWVFKGASRAATVAPTGDPFFLSTANTFRRLRGNEFEMAEPYRLRIVRASEGTTIAQLADISPVRKYPEQQLRLFNKLYPEGEPQPGALVKTVR